MAGLPGAYERYDIPGLRRMLGRYRDIDAARLRENLARFLREVIPWPKRSASGWRFTPTIRRVRSSACRASSRMPTILPSSPKSSKSPSNGITLCCGSLGAGADNDVPAIARRFADRIHFAHLRNVAKEADGSFMEADHLGGDTDMVAVVVALLEEQKRRKSAGRADWRIPMRPDHGHELLDDVGKPTHPGYPAIGRLKGLAELRGVMSAVSALRSLPL